MCSSCSVQQQKIGCPGSCTHRGMPCQCGGMSTAAAAGVLRRTLLWCDSIRACNDDDDGTFITPHYSNNFPGARSSSSRHWTLDMHHTAPRPTPTPQRPIHAPRALQAPKPEWLTVSSFFTLAHVLFLNRSKYSTWQHWHSNSAVAVQRCYTIFECCTAHGSPVTITESLIVSLCRLGTRGAYSIVR
jgi:hypothetical protein